MCEPMFWWFVMESLGNRAWFPLASKGKFCFGRLTLGVTLQVLVLARQEQTSREPSAIKPLNCWIAHLGLVGGGGRALLGSTILACRLPFGSSRPVSARPK